MHGRLLLLGLGLLGAVLPGGAIAQEYINGLYIPPLPVAPSLYPGGAMTYSSPATHIDVNVTGSVPQVMTAFPERGGVDRRRCDVQSYSFGSRTVRVHRC
jgi:hypothetical protein